MSRARQVLVAAALFASALPVAAQTPRLPRGGGGPGPGGGTGTQLVCFPTWELPVGIDPCSGVHLIMQSGFNAPFSSNGTPVRHFYTCSALIESTGTDLFRLGKGICRCNPPGLSSCPPDPCSLIDSSFAPLNCARGDCEGDALTVRGEVNQQTGELEAVLDICYNVDWPYTVTGSWGLKVHVTNDDYPMGERRLGSGDLADDPRASCGPNAYVHSERFTVEPGVEYDVKLTLFGSSCEMIPDRHLRGETENYQFTLNGPGPILPEFYP